jgi:thiamine pyrophosphokinase
MPAEERVQHDTVVVVAGGGSTHSLPADIPLASAVVAADGGVDVARELGLQVDVVVGDFDSASRAGLAAAEASGARLVRHPEEKDATDLELALDEAASLNPSRIVVVGVPGGRLDHLLAGMMVLAAEPYSRFDIDVLVGPVRAYVVRDGRSVDGRPGELVSLLPMHGPAEGVVTDGLVYPLRAETLRPGSSRGVSNRFAAPTARISLARGAVLVVCPGRE